MKVFRIQDTGNKVGEAGAVATGVYAEYAGEAETITLGFAPGNFNEPQTIFPWAPCGF